MSRWILSQLGTNHSSGAERSMCNKFGCYQSLFNNKYFGITIFVCMTLIGVKSKYGSCSGNCTGLIIITIFLKKYFSLKVKPMFSTVGFGFESQK